MNRVHFVVPEWINDPTRPSGGNHYDRRVADELRLLGWEVIDSFGAESLAGIPSGDLVLVDGLIACAAEPVRVAAERLQLVVLVHMAFDECTVLPFASAVVTTSTWTRDRLVAQYRLPPERMYVARPGVDAADLALGTLDGSSLLCVGAVARHKGQDVLLDALAAVNELSWRCTCVGTLDGDPEFVVDLQAHAAADRVDFTGPLTGSDLDRSYATADVLVLPTRGEGYGMVVTEALARGLPVIASDVGGVPEALGGAGLLVPPDDPAALATAMRRWLTDSSLRTELRALARERRGTLTDWSVTARHIAAALTEVERVRP